MNPTAIVAYLLFFATVAFCFIFASLLLGRFLRPKAPVLQKHEIYECGEPTIGSSFVQFDLRFYVVALVFIVFEVEAAFFFPWAVVFGTSTRLLAPSVPKVEMARSAGSTPTLSRRGGRRNGRFGSSRSHPPATGRYCRTQRPGDRGRIGQTVVHGTPRRGRFFCRAPRRVCLCVEARRFELGPKLSISVRWPRCLNRRTRLLRWAK